MGGACGMYREKRNIYRLLVGKYGRDHLGSLSVGCTILLTILIPNYSCEFKQSDRN